MGTDTELMSQLMTKHQTVMSILSSRQASLQVVRGFWAQGDARGALSAVLQSAGMHPMAGCSLATQLHCWQLAASLSTDEFDSIGA